MCGCVGVIDLTGRLGADRMAAVVRAMADLQHHRGPDDGGVWVAPDGRAALGHRRLAIIDLSPEGRQPMQAPGCRSVVVYNGEIYNFARLRRRLEARGCQFVSRCDTEILPHLFDTLDPAGLASLEGMFAFGLWRDDLRRLLLARDGFGEKPLYVYEDDDVFAFSSEIQSFYALPSFEPAIDRDALADYLMLGYVPGPATIYRRVRMIMPGHYEVVDFAGDRPRLIDRAAFFRFEAHENPALAGLDRAAIEATLTDHLIDAVERRLVSDVPLGAFLSGGVDSALIAAIVRRELGRELDTFSMGFTGSAESEHEAARDIASHLGTRHHERMVAPEGLADMALIAAALDQPNGDSSCLPTYLLSAFARESVTVCLSGDGGDELFGGYGRYRDTLNDWAEPERIRAHIGIDPDTATPADVYMSLRWHIWLPPDADRLLGGLPAPAKARVNAWRARLNDDRHPLLHRMRTLDTALYMPGSVLAKVDRMSMRHALEVRCPMLDRSFASLAMGLWADDCWQRPATTKAILKSIASRYLPADWMHRPKKGFGLPSSAWSMGPIMTACRERLLAPNGQLLSHLDRAALTDTVERQSRPGQFSIYQMWPLLILEHWLAAQPAKRAAARALTQKEAA